MRVRVYARLKSALKFRRLPKAVEPWQFEMPNTSLFSRRKRALAREVKRRVNNPGFDQLAALYGVTLPKNNFGRRLATLKELATTHWDFRKGKMRHEVDFATVTADESVIDLASPKNQRVIEDAAASFGLAAPSHASRDSYDGLIVPGGTGLSPFLRLKFALGQTGPSGRPVEFGWIALLGCDRTVDKQERERVKMYAPKARTEFDLMVAAAEELLELTLVRDANMRKVGYAYDRETQPHVRYYKDVSGMLVMVFNAPIPVGDVKANTGHTYDFLRAASGPRIGRGRHVLLSSTSHVRAFQHVDAERLLSLPTGVSLETIGFGKNYSILGVDDSVMPPPRPPKELLQEIKSYVDTLVKLKKATTLTAKDKGVVSQV